MKGWDGEVDGVPEHGGEALAEDGEVVWAAGGVGDDLILQAAPVIADGGLAEAEGAGDLVEGDVLVDVEIEDAIPQGDALGAAAGDVGADAGLEVGESALQGARLRGLGLLCQGLGGLSCACPVGGCFAWHGQRGGRGCGRRFLGLRRGAGGMAEKVGKKKKV